MSARGRKIVIGLVLAVALIGGAATMVLVRALTQRPTAPPALAQVPERWREVRRAPGHVAHLALPDVGCTSCHGEGFARPDDAACQRCHDTHRAVLHAAADAAAGRPCTACHDFAAVAEVGPKNCRRCHDESPARRHSGEDCTTCHRPHREPSRAPGACVDCHLDRKGRHGARDPEQAATCLECHTAHGGDAPATACAACHAGTTPRVAPRALAGAKHDCVGCHAGHDFAASAARPCRACHQATQVLGATRAAAHRDCASCHAPHDVGDAAARCVGCHPQASAHPLKPVGGCVGCHAPHGPGVATATVRSCASCHQAATDRAFHAASLACRDCHPPHGAGALVTRGSASCARCHAGPAGEAAAGKGHRACLNCHVGAAHRPGATPPSCGFCHGDQARTAPAGHREQCRTCHDEHRADVTPAAACATCHADRTRGPHARVVGACATCHRPHGPRGVARPPACSSCHPAATLPGVHAVKGHARCVDCHGAHSAPRGERAACMTCHQGLQAHEPTATRCTGCHPFGD